MDLSIGACWSRSGRSLHSEVPLVYGTVRINPFKLIQGVTGGLFAGLLQTDIDELATTIKTGFDAFLSMTISCCPPFGPHKAGSAAVETSTGCRNVEMEFTQAVEKTLNDLLRHTAEREEAAAGRTSARPRSIVELAEALGSDHLDRSLIAEVQCKADVRYPGRVALTQRDAVRANQASVTLCGAVARQWTRPQRSVERCGSFAESTPVIEREHRCHRYEIVARLTKVQTSFAARTRKIGLYKTASTPKAHTHASRRRSGALKATYAKTVQHTHLKST